MNFHDFKAPVQAQFKRMTQHDLFCVDVTGDELWQHYLASFPEGTNPIYRKRAEHDCSCCRQFVKTVGGVVAIVDGHIQSIWDANFREDATTNETAYRAVADGMAALVKSKAIDRPFLHWEKRVGTNKNYSKAADGPLGPVETFHHFYVEIPWAKNEGKNFFCPGKDIPTKIGELKSTRDLYLRGLSTITRDALDTVIELIANKSLYRGEEYLHAVKAFSQMKASFDSLPDQESRELFTWHGYDKIHASVARIRNTAIGTLLIDLSEGMDLEGAVRKFETSVMAPTSYKRPTALVSKAMVDKARQAVAELGIGDALERRHARLTDISVNDILFADRSARKVMAGDVFDQIQTTSSKPKSLDKVETVTIDAFVKDILPKVDSIEVMLENKHAGNLVSLIAPQHRNAKPIFKWGNGFSWTYNGEVADSIKERVKRAGGNVTGDLCCRLAWFNNDDLDFHMVEPARVAVTRKHEIMYTNKRSLSPAGGMLDVDMNGGDGLSETREPVENIFYGSRRTMIEGVYELSVVQYSRRETIDHGFDVEIDWLGEVRRFYYDKPVTGRVVVARMRYSHDGGIEILESLPSTQASRTVWGLKTQDFHRVTTMMLSPNHWGDGNGTGNKHFFFMLDGCVNEDRPRGFFNEFLIDELTPHRKVIEIVGAKSKVEPSIDQLSGLGFSSTQRNELLVRAKGSYSRIIKIAF